MSEFIPINITKAKVVAISLKYGKDKLEFNAEVSLLNDREEQVTSIYVGNGNWDEKNNAEMSIETIELAKKVRKEVEISVIRHMNKKQNIIEHKE